MQEGTSSPHITVVQFNCESLDLAHKVWEKLCKKMSEENLVPFSLSFTGIAFVEGVGLYENTTWVELSIQRGNKNSPIMKVHNAALELLEEFNLKDYYARTDESMA